ncbi:MAG: ribonuclease [Thermoleophilia bacterium]|nr:ribonuclease [Thermoleophilia bacterium]
MAAPPSAPRTSDIRHVANVAFVKRLQAALAENHLMMFAKGLAYGGVFAVVPILALLVLLLGVFNAVELVNTAMAELRPVLPADVLELIDTQLTNVATTDASGAFGVGAIISALVALWGASGAMRSMTEALNVVHGLEVDSRSAVVRFGMSFLLAIGAIILLSLVLVIMVVGGGAADLVFDIVDAPGAAGTWNIVRWPVLVVVAWLGIALLFRFGPAKRVGHGLATPGTLIATAGWISFSALFSWYVGGIGSVDGSWGAVAGVIVFLLYLQYSGLIILLGAQVDVLLAHDPSGRGFVQRAKDALARA